MLNQLLSLCHVPWQPPLSSQTHLLSWGTPDWCSRCSPKCCAGRNDPFPHLADHPLPMQPAEQFTFAAWRQSTAWYPALLTRTHPFLQSCSLARQAGPGQCEGLSCPKSRTWPGSCQRTPVASAEPHGYSCLLSCVNLHSDTSHMPFVQQLWIWSWCPRAWTHSWVTLLKVDCYPL